MTAIHTANFLLGLLEGVAIPADSDVWGDVIFPCRDGWTVTIFYDCGELDYIDCFTDPSGNKVNFWDWPESPDQKRLINWRG